MKNSGSFVTFVSLALGLGQTHASDFPICKEHYFISETQTHSKQTSLEKILKNNPQDVDCMLKLASVYFRTSKVSKGFDLVRDAYKINPQYVQKRNISKVLDLALRLSRLREFAQKNADKKLWNELGNAYYEMGIFIDAKIAFEASLKLDSKQTKIEILVALCEGNMGRMKASARHLKQIVLENPYDFYANYYYGKVLKNELNNAKEGMKYLKMAEYLFVHHNPSFERESEKDFLKHDLKRELSDER